MVRVRSVDKSSRNSRRSCRCRRCRPSKSRASSRRSRSKSHHRCHRRHRLHRRTLRGGMTQCPICAEEILAGQEVVRPNSNTCTKHLIHRECEELIPADMNKCPVCRAPFTRFVDATPLTQAEIDEEAEAERRAAAMLPTTLPPELEARIQARHAGRAAEEAEHAARVEQAAERARREEEAARLRQEEFDRRSTWNRVLRKFPDENVYRMTDPRDILPFLKSSFKSSSYAESLFITKAEMASILPPSFMDTERNIVLRLVKHLNRHNKPEMINCIVALQRHAERQDVFNEEISEALKGFNKSYEEVVKTYRFFKKVLDGHRELLVPVINQGILNLTPYTENAEDNAEENGAWLATRRAFEEKLQRNINIESITNTLLNHLVIISQFPFPIRMVIFDRKKRQLDQVVRQVNERRRKRQEEAEANARQVRPRLN